MAIVSVHALSSGYITLPERFFVTPSDPGRSIRVPSLSFLIQHGDGDAKTRILFDAGIRREISRYDLGIQKHMRTRFPYETQPDVVESLAKGDVTADDIDYVFFSHIHWDHVGMPPDFGKSKFVVGRGAFDLINKKTVLTNGKHSNFENLLLPEDRTMELPDPDVEASSVSFNGKTNKEVAEMSLEAGPWHSKFLFSSVIDLFQDGSTYIVSAPGHLPGHINLLCRISMNPDRYVYLAGDACHDVRLLTGERDIATWTDRDDPGAIRCIHADKEMAAKTIETIRQAGQGKDEDLGDVEIVFAHDLDWDKKAAAEGRFWPGKL